MANFCELVDGKVVRVIIVNNSDCGGGDFPDSEAIGQDFIAQIGIDGQWLQTSYNNNFRGVYGQVGFTYNPDVDQFIPPPIPEIEEAPNE